MTPKQIGEQLVAIHTALVEKTGEQPFLSICLRLSDAGGCSINLYRAYNDGDYGVGRAEGDTFEACIADAFRIIAEMPDADEAAKRTFQKNLANVIDEGNSLSMPADVMKPLGEASKALSSNLLTHSEARSASVVSA